MLFRTRRDSSLLVAPSQLAAALQQHKHTRKVSGTWRGDGRAGLVQARRGRACGRIDRPEQLQRSAKSVESLRII